MAGKGRAGFIISIVMLITGMTIGFILLSLVYTGPVWVKLLVFILYLFVATMTIRFSARFVKAMKEDSQH